MKKRVFIVDQNRDSALAFAAAMRAEEVSPQIFTDDVAFYAAIEELLPDLVVLRGEMPKISGYAICNRLRSQPRTQELHVVIIALKNDDQMHAHEQSQLKADAYVAPPHGLKDLRIHAFDLLGLDGGMAEEGSVKDAEDDSFDKLDAMLTPTENSMPAPVAEEPLAPERRKHNFSEEDIDGAFDQLDGKPKSETPPPAAPVDEEPQLIEDESIVEVPQAPAMLSPLHDMSEDDLAFVSRSFAQNPDGSAPPLPPGISRKEDLVGPDAKIYQLREALREKEQELYRLQQIWQQHEKQFQESAQQVLEKEVEVRQLHMEVDDLRGTLKRKDDESKQHAREYSASMDRMIEEKVLLEKDLIEVVASKEKIAYEQRRMLAARERDIEEMRTQNEQKEMALIAQQTQERATYEQQLAELRGELAMTVAQANEEREAGARANAEQRSEFETRTADMQRLHEQQVSELRAAAEAELTQTRTTLEERLEQTRIALEQQLAETKAERDATVEGAKADFELALGREQGDREAQVLELKGELELQKQQAEARSAVLSERRDELDRQLGDKERQVQVQDTELAALREKLNDREAMVSSKDSGLQRVAAELNETKQRLISKEAELSDTQATLRGKEERDLEQSTTIARLTERLMQSEAALSEQRQNSEAGASDLQTKLDARTQAAEQLQSELGTLRERLSTLESTASERAATLMQELEAAQQKQKDMQHKLEQRLDQKDQIIAQKDTTLEQLSKEVGTSREEREALLQRLSERLRERETTITQQGEEIQKLKEGHVQSQGSFDARMKEVSGGLEAQVREAQQRAMAAEARVADLTTARERLDKEVVTLGARLSEVQTQAGEKLDAQMLELEQMKQFLKLANERAVAASAPAPAEDDALLADVGKKLGL